MIANNARIERALQDMELELKVLNYAKKTQKTYLACFRKFCAFYRKSPTSFNLKEIKNFLISKQNDGCAPQTVNLYLNSLKFYYRHILKSKNQIDLRFAKRNKKIPIVLSRIEITRLISHVKNPKHKLIISLAYGSGLRVSEVTNLRVQDLDFQQQIIHLKVSKGSRERITVLSKKIIPHLSQYVAGKRPNDFVFESNRGGQLSTRTLQKVFSNSLIQANIKKQATFHSLRHAFATHLLENGTDIFYIQKLLGHRNIQTTQIYTRITNPGIQRINSPF